MPEGIGVVDLMIGFPQRDRKAVYEYLRKGAKDSESKDMSFLAEYMFKDVPDEVDDDRGPRRRDHSPRWTSTASTPGSFGLNGCTPRPATVTPAASSSRSRSTRTT